MINIKKMTSIGDSVKLKGDYLEQTTAPLDDMWQCGFVPMASHFGFYEGETLVGFYCVNAEGYLLQYFLSPEYQSQSSLLFESVIEGCELSGNINGAFVSTAEPLFMSLCLDHFSEFKVKAFMYQLGQNMTFTKTEGLSLSLMSSDQLGLAVGFAKLHIGAPEEWLLGYFGNLIQRQELYAFWQNGQLLATGECRVYDDYQTAYAYIGVIVAGPERGKGLATGVLQELVSLAQAKELIPICSTDNENIGAQKAIERAGFFAPHRIVQFDRSI